MSAWMHVCWAELPGGKICAGRVTWVFDGGRWRSSCSSCSATGTAACGEASELVRLFGRSAVECQGVSDGNA